MHVNRYVFVFTIEIFKILIKIVIIDGIGEVCNYMVI
jgi:hypothetical protein